MIGFRAEILFDKSKLQRRVERKERRVLFRAGGYARRVLRSSMKSGGKRNAVSKPGEPPRAHGNKLLRNLITFGVEGLSVVIGPELTRTGKKRLKQKQFRRGRRAEYRVRSNKTLPEVVNEGGVVERITEFQSGELIRERIKYEPRPFRDLAMPKAIDKLSDLLAKEQL